MICAIIVLLGGLILIGVVFVCIIAIKRENDREIAFYSNTPRVISNTKASCPCCGSTDVVSICSGCGSDRRVG